MHILLTLVLVAHLRLKKAMVWHVECILFVQKKVSKKIKRFLLSQADLLVKEKSAKKTRKSNLGREGCNAKVIFKMTIDRKYELCEVF